MVCVDGAITEGASFKIILSNGYYFFRETYVPRWDGPVPREKGEGPIASEVACYLIP